MTAQQQQEEVDDLHLCVCVCVWGGWGGGGGGGKGEGMSVYTWCRYVLRMEVLPKSHYTCFTPTPDFEGRDSSS